MSPPRHQKISAAEERGLWEGVVQEPLRRALFCVFLCSEVIFSCKSHRNFFQKLPLQCRHFLENPPREKPQNAAAENCQGYWAQQYIRHSERHSQERHLFATTPSKNPLILVRELSLRPGRPLTGVSEPSGPEIPKKSQKRVFCRVRKKVPENTRKSKKHLNPEGPVRHLFAPDCRGTIFAPVLPLNYPHHEGILRTI